MRGGTGQGRAGQGRDRGRGASAGGRDPERCPHAGGVVGVGIADAVQRAKAGEVEFKANKEGLVHGAVGKVRRPAMRWDALHCTPPRKVMQCNGCTALRPGMQCTALAPSVHPVMSCVA